MRIIQMTRHIPVRMSEVGSSYRSYHYHFVSTCMQTYDHTRETIAALMVHYGVVLVRSGHK